jgi:hypothetical protein
VKNRWIIASIFWALVILVLCSIPGKDLPTASWFELISLDKWVHAAMFAIQYLFLIRAFTDRFISDIFRSSKNWWAVLIAVFYGAFTEYYQHAFLTDRVADIYDFIANIIGVLIGLLIYKRYAARFLWYSTQEKTL